MKHNKNMTRTLLTGVVGLTLIGGLIAGCRESNDALTVPQQSTSTDQVGQCFATSEAPTEWAYSYTPGDAVFCVSVPEAGAYLLRYVVNGGTHEVVFDVSAAKRVYIGLLSNADELTAVSLQRGTLRDGATPLEGDRGDIRFYALPGSGGVSSSVLSDLSEAFALSNNGAPCLVIIPTPTPDAPVVLVPTNAAPVATIIPFASGGTHCNLGVCHGLYTYTDAEGDPEGTSLYQWYVADDASGTNAAAIPGATQNYFIGATSFKYYQFRVTPVAVSGTSPGSTAVSAWVWSM